MKQVRIGLAGFGTVGSAVYRHIKQEASSLFERCGIHLVVTAVAVRNPRSSRRKGMRLPKSLLLPKVEQIATGNQTDLVVEVMGGCGAARNLILSALRAGKPVITANKALLAEHGREIFEESNRKGVPIYFEASVGGGIPIIKSLQEGLVANRFSLIYGIVNGTCNYILSRMSQEGIGFDAVLKQAKALGYVEADASFDIDGIDAAHKATILASLAYGGCVDFRRVYVESIRHVSAEDVQFAHQLGYEIKLLAIIRSLGKERVEVRVHPTLIPKSNRLAAIHGVTNAIVVRGHVVGDIEFSGPGAGGDATASAILSDIVQAASFLHSSSSILHPSSFIPHPFFSNWLCTRGPYVIDINEVISCYYLRLSVTDRPGVIAQISSILGKAKIGISSMIQPEGHEGKTVPLIFMIHNARHDMMQKSVKQIHRLQCVKTKPVMLHVETFTS